MVVKAVLAMTTHDDDNHGHSSGHCEVVLVGKRWHDVDDETLEAACLISGRVLWLYGTRVVRCMTISRFIRERGHRETVTHNKAHGRAPLHKVAERSEHEHWNAGVPTIVAVARSNKAHMCDQQIVDNPLPYGDITITPQAIPFRTVTETASRAFANKRPILHDLFGKRKSTIQKCWSGHQESPSTLRQHFFNGFGLMTDLDSVTFPNNNC